MSGVTILTILPTRSIHKYWYIQLFSSLVYMKSTYMSLLYLINNEQFWNFASICQYYICVLLHNINWCEEQVYTIYMYDVIQSLHAKIMAIKWLHIQLTVSCTASGSTCRSSWASTPTCCLSSSLEEDPGITPFLYWYWYSCSWLTCSNCLPLSTCKTKIDKNENHLHGGLEFISGEKHGVLVLVDLFS